MKPGQHHHERLSRPCLRPRQHGRKAWRTTQLPQYKGREFKPTESPRHGYRVTRPVSGTTRRSIQRGLPADILEIQPTGNSRMMDISTAVDAQDMSVSPEQLDDSYPYRYSQSIHKYSSLQPATNACATDRRGRRNQGGTRDFTSLQGRGNQSGNGTDGDSGPSNHNWYTLETLHKT